MGILVLLTICVKSILYVSLKECMSHIYLSTKYMLQVRKEIQRC